MGNTYYYNYFYYEYFLAIKANEMTKIQTEVARNSSLPNIQVVEKNLINEKTGKTDDSIIQISNLNGRLNNYESRIVTFLKMFLFR